MAPRQTQSTKAPKGRLAGSIRASDAPEPPTVPPKSKSSVSMSGMFKKKQHPRATAVNGAAEMAKPSLNGIETRITKPVVRAHPPPILKKQGHTPRKPPDHPLSVAFKETTANYRTAVLTSAQTALRETHGALVARLNESSFQLAQGLHAAAATPAPLPLRDEQLAVTTTSPATSGAPVRTLTTLGAQADAFRATVAREECRLARLQKDWLAIQSQISAFAVVALGPAEGGALCQEAGVVVDKGDIDAAAGDAWKGLDDAEAALSAGREEMRKEIEGLGEEAVEATESEIREEERRGKELKRSIVGLLRDQLGVVDGEGIE